MPTTVYKPDGTALQVPEAEAQAGLASGDYRLPKGTRVNVTENGKLGTIPAENAAADLARPGVKLASPDAIQHAHDERQYGGVLGHIAAGVGGALGSASMGITDDLAAALGPEGTKEYLEGAYRTNPGTHLAGQVVGAFAPAFVGDEAGILGALGEAGEGAEAASALGKTGEALGTAGKVITAPSRAVSSVGRGIEGALSRALNSEEGSLISRLAKGAAAKGAGFAAEGAAYGLADQVSEDMLGDHELNAEKLYASGVHGALLGLAGGAALSAAGTVGSDLLGRLTPSLRSMAETQALRAIEVKGAAVKAAEDSLPGGMKAAARTAIDNGDIRMGDTVEDIAPRLEKRLDEAGANVGKAYKTLDESAVEKVRVADVTEKLRKDVIPELEKLKELNAPAIAKVERTIAGIERFGGVAEKGAVPEAERAVHLEHATIGFQQLQDLRTQLRKNINWKMPNPDAVENRANEAMKDAYGIITKELESKAEKAASALGGSMKDELRDANLAYRQYLALSQAAEKAVGAKLTRNMLSPSTHAYGLLAGVGALAHGLSGGASLAATVGAGAARHLWKERGAASAAVFAEKLAALRGVERATARVDREIDRGIAGILREPGRAQPTLREMPEGPYRSHAEAALHATKNIAAHRTGLGEAIAPLAQHAPNTARAFQSVGVRAAQYAAKIVPHRQPVQTLTPHLDEPRVSKADEQTYMLAVRAQHDPVSVLDDMAKGRATRAQVDALKQTFPKMYAEITQKIQERLADRTDPLPYESRKQLALLFGPMAGPEFDPAFQARMQADFASPPAPSGPGKGGPPRGGAPKRMLKTTVDARTLGD